MSEPARAAKPVNDALADGKRKAAAGRARPPVGSAGLFALQRSAGNAAVSALMAGKVRSPGEQAVTDIDARAEGDAPRRAGDRHGREGAQGGQGGRRAGRPRRVRSRRPSALAVTTTGFGPGSVAPKKPVPPTKPVPAVSPLGKAASQGAPRPAGGKGGAGRGAGGAAGRRRRRRGRRARATVRRPAAAAAGRRRAVARPEDDPAFTQVTGKVKAFAKAKRAHPPAASKAKEAQDAALAPTDDVGRAGQGGQGRHDGRPAGGHRSTRRRSSRR